jgi:hypothetical protein
MAASVEDCLKGMHDDAGGLGWEPSTTVSAEAHSACTVVHWSPIQYSTHGAVI